MFPLKSIFWKTDRKYDLLIDRKKRNDNKMERKSREGQAHKWKDNGRQFKHNIDCQHSYIKRPLPLSPSLSLSRKRILSHSYSRLVANWQNIPESNQTVPSFITHLDPVQSTIFNRFLLILPIFESKERYLMNCNLPNYYLFITRCLIINWLYDINSCMRRGCD